jgi:RHS repeat-associated protein
MFKTANFVSTGNLSTSSKWTTLYCPPFGSSILGLQYAYSDGADTSKYRFGFNNQEQDAELGEYYAFEYRIHDARLGRFLSVDPLKYQFPFWSPYQFSGNQCITSRDLEGLEVEDNLNFGEEIDGPGMMDDNKKPTISAEGQITYSSLQMQNRVENAIREYNKKERNVIGKFLHNSDFKLIKNPIYQPEIAAVINNAKTKGISIYLTDNYNDVAEYDGSGGRIQGVLIKTSKTNYVVFAQPVFDIEKIGTDPLWEEIFHLSNAINPIYEYSYTERNGHWGIFDKNLLLQEEARAKFMVLTKIKDITQYYFQPIDALSEGESRFGIYAHTSFGAMLDMTESEILIFISTNPMKVHLYYIWEYTYRTDGNFSTWLRIPQQMHGEVMPQQGAYNHLLNE